MAICTNISIILKVNVEGFKHLKCSKEMSKGFFFSKLNRKIYRKGKNPNMKGKYIGRIKYHLSKPVCRLKTKIVKATITTIRIKRIGNKDEKLDIKEHKMWGRAVRTMCVSRSVMSDSLRPHGL